MSLDGFNASSIYTYGMQNFISWKYSIKGGSLIANSLILNSSEIHFLFASSDLPYVSLGNISFFNGISSLLFSFNPLLIEIQNIQIRNLSINYYFLITYGPTSNNYEVFLTNMTFKNFTRQYDYQIFYIDSIALSVKGTVITDLFSRLEQFQTQVFIFLLQRKLIIREVFIKISKLNILSIFFFENVISMTLTDMVINFDEKDYLNGFISLLISKKCVFAELNNIFVSYFKGKPGEEDPYLSNGLLNFISSDSFYSDANNHKVVLRDIILIGNEGWERGIIGFLNIHYIYIFSLFTMSSKTSLGGVIFIAYSTNVELSDLTFHNSTSSTTLQLRIAKYSLKLI